MKRTNLLEILRGNAGEVEGEGGGEEEGEAEGEEQGGEKGEGDGHGRRGLGRGGRGRSEGQKTMIGSDMEGGKWAKAGEEDQSRSKDFAPRIHVFSFIYFFVLTQLNKNLTFGLFFFFFFFGPQKSDIFKLD